MIDPQLTDTPPEITSKTLRQFAGLWLAFWAGLASWQWFGLGHATTACVLGSLGLLVGGWGLLRPLVIRPLFRGLLAVTYPVGWIVSNLIVVILFFGLITPVALLFKLMRRDVLCRRRPQQQASYWLTKPQPADIRSYFHQY